MEPMSGLLFLTDDVGTLADLIFATCMTLSSPSISAGVQLDGPLDAGVKMRSARAEWHLFCRLFGTSVPHDGLSRFVVRGGIHEMCAVVNISREIYQ